MGVGVLSFLALKVAPIKGMSKVRNINKPYSGATFGRVAWVPVNPLIPETLLVCLWISRTWARELFKV